MKKFLLPFELLALALLLGACAGSREVRVTQGSEQVGSAPTGTVFATTAASIVHVDEIERIATIRRGRGFPKGAFLQTTSREGEQTALLKAQPNRLTGLRTAYILEGEPFINDSVTLVSASERRRLETLYPDPGVE